MAEAIAAAMDVMGYITAHTPSALGIEASRNGVAMDAQDGDEKMA